VEDRVDEVAVHGIRLGTTLGLAAMATHRLLHPVARLPGQHTRRPRRDRSHLGAPRWPRRCHCRTHSSPVCAKQAFRLDCTRDV
jgi:hypothetical protein